MNKVMLIGRLTAKPELRYTGSNLPFARFSVAVNRTFSNSQGQRETDFINCVVWRKQAENVKKYTMKGSLVGVEGRIQTRSYTGTDGVKKYVTEVIADSVQFLGSRGKGDSSNRQDEQTDNVPPYDYTDIPPEMPTTNIADKDPYMDYRNNVEITDDLPF